MVIERHNKDGKTVFSVCGDVRETGDKRPHEIATFDTLTTAALVMKYMRGDRLPPCDAATAKDALVAAQKEGGEKNVGGDACG